MSRCPGPVTILCLFGYLTPPEATSPIVWVQCKRPGINGKMVGNMAVWSNLSYGSTSHFPFTFNVRLKKSCIGNTICKCISYEWWLIVYCQSSSNIHQRRQRIKDVAARGNGLCIYSRPALHIRRFRRNSETARPFLFRSQQWSISKSLSSKFKVIGSLRFVES